ncbi:MAG: lipoate--protein ligase family protein, partial [Streptosporangiaceae bacterium]
MHGAYKEPGGKLVAADVVVAGGRLAQVRISGDFFPEPEEALERIDAAVTGLPDTADTEAIIARVDAALGEDAILAGFSAEAVAVAVAVAVRRALT